MFEPKSCNEYKPGGVGFIAPCLRLLSMLLWLGSQLPLQAQFQFTTNSGVITITAYTGSGGAVVIPSETNGYPVTSIGFQAFGQSPSQVTSVTIPDSVTNIARSAFPSCFLLTNVIMSTNVITMGDYVFDACHNLRTITLPSTLTSLGVYAFAYCGSLTNLILGQNLTSVRDHAFDSCSNLLSISIPRGVTNIGNYAFFLCRNLTNLTMGDSIQSIGSQAFEGCESLTSLQLPGALATIGDYAFYNCFNVTNLTIPAGLASIGSLAFAYCSGLTAYFFPSNAPILGSGVFTADKAVVYYLPWTTGLGPTFGGLRALPWLPQIQTGTSSFGVRTNQFGFDIAWADGTTVVIESCTNLAAPIWVPVTTNILNSGSWLFVDPGWTNYSSRFYRARSFD